VSENFLNYITDFINSHHSMILGVAEADIPYGCMVWYSCRDGKNLYFMSRTATQHCQITLNCPQVSVIIYNSAGKYAIKKGIQLLGKVERVNEMGELNKVAANYIKDFPNAENLVNSLLPIMVQPGAHTAFFRVVIEQGKELGTEAAIMSQNYVNV
jgi:uncharacterized protein YhbP (UPF0306 family)